jgi:hypothetical protein
MLIRNRKYPAACAIILGLAVLVPGLGGSLAAESLISSAAVTAAASESRATPDALLAPVNAALVESSEPAGPVIQTSEPPSSIVSAIGFLYLCAGFVLFKPRRRMQAPQANFRADAQVNRISNFNR